MGKNFSSEFNNPIMKRTSSTWSLGYIPPTNLRIGRYKYMSGDETPEDSSIKVPVSKPLTSNIFISKRETQWDDPFL
jgi:hypothetical protein